MFSFFKKQDFFCLVWRGIWQRAFVKFSTPDRAEILPSALKEPNLWVNLHVAAAALRFCCLNMIVFILPCDLWTELLRTDSAACRFLCQLCTYPDSFSFCQGLMLWTVWVHSLLPSEVVFLFFFYTRVVNWATCVWKIKLCVKPDSWQHSLRSVWLSSTFTSISVDSPPCYSQHKINVPNTPAHIKI